MSEVSGSALRGRVECGPGWRAEEGARLFGSTTSATLASRPQATVPSGLTAWQRRRISTHIDAHLGTGIRIKDLATVLCLSYSHFCRSFRISFGIPPHLYVMRRRIELAQTLMLTTPANLSEIALACGMSDQSHLTRVFRRIVGDTPHAWRRSRLSGNGDDRSGSC